MGSPSQEDAASIICKLNLDLVYINYNFLVNAVRFASPSSALECL